MTRPMTPPRGASRHQFVPESANSLYCRCGLHKSEIDHQPEGEVPPPPAPAPHVTIDGEAVELANRIENILSSCGSFSSCKTCLEPIYWMSGIGGKKLAFDRLGTNHHATCKGRPR